jgi:hypothetical protein
MEEVSRHDLSLFISIPVALQNISRTLFKAERSLENPFVKQRTSSMIKYGKYILDWILLNL